MAAATPVPLEPIEEEQRMLLPGVSWRAYVMLRESLDAPGLRMTFCEGVLELSSPSKEHERRKSLVGRLLEHYAIVQRLPLNAYGSTTFRLQGKEGGAEPDECYCFGRELEEGEFPDLVIEVLEKSPLLDKLHVYDGLAIPEVWLLRAGKVEVHRRKALGGYEVSSRSGFLPDLDLELLVSFLDRRDQTAAVAEFAEKAR